MKQRVIRVLCIVCLSFLFLPAEAIRIPKGIKKLFTLWKESKWGTIVFSVVGHRVYTEFQNNSITSPRDTTDVMWSVDNYVRADSLHKTNTKNDDASGFYLIRKSGL